MAIDQDTIARRLKEARTNCGLTQEAAAAGIGLTRTAVVNIESGKRALSTLELSQFAKLYHRPVTFFFETDESASVEPADLILARQLPGFQDDPFVKQAVAWCSEVCRIGIELETLLGRRPRISPPT